MSACVCVCLCVCVSVPLFFFFYFFFFFFLHLITPINKFCTSTAIKIPYEKGKKGHCNYNCSFGSEIIKNRRAEEKIICWSLPLIVDRSRSQSPAASNCALWRRWQGPLSLTFRSPSTHPPLPFRFF